MPRRARLAPLLALSLLLACTGSSKEAARAAAGAAIDAAEAAIRPLKFEATRYAPKHLETTQATLLKAREQLAAGDYQAALALTVEVKAKVQEMAASIEHRKAQLVKEFEGAAGGLPAQLEALTARLAELTSAKQLPRGLDAARVQAAREDLEKAAQGWESAKAKATEGSLGEALAYLEATKAKVAQVAATLGTGAKAP